MNFAAWVQNHRRSILFLLALLVVGGVASFTQLPESLFPQVQFPRVRVSLNAGARPAQEMMLQVTRPVERAVRAVPGVHSVRSTTSRGSTDISINFAWGHDMLNALLQVESAVNQIKPDLPPGTRFTAKRMYPANYSGVIAYSLTSHKLSQVKLHDLAQYQMVPFLSSVKGVAKVTVQGGEKAEYQVTVKPDQLQALGLSIRDVAKALSASNVLNAVGKVQDHYKLYLTVSDTRFKSINQIRHTVLKSGSDGEVQLEDVASVKLGTAPEYQRMTADGQRAVLLNVYQQPGASVLQMSKDLKARLKQFQSQMPKGVQLHQWRNLGVLVKASRSGVVDAIVIGVILAALVLLLFLRSWKITLVAVIAVPAVLAATMLVLYALGMSLNMMTLGGMAAAVGLIIDDVIVMVEQVVRRVQETGEHGIQRVLASAREFTQPQVGSSTSTIIIFLPLAFLSGITGAFFKELSLTMAVSLFISFLVAWLVVPLLADFMLGPKDVGREKIGRIGRRVYRGYSRLMVRLMRRPAWLLVGLVPLVAVAYIAFGQVGSGFLPHLDEGNFILDYRSAPGTSLDETNRLLEQVATILKKNPYVDTWSRRTGAQLSGRLAEPNTGDFFVRLKSSRPSTEAVMAQVRKKVNARIPGLDVEFAQPIEDEIGDLTAVPQPIDIRLFGNDVAKLRQVANHVAQAIGSVHGVVGIQNGVVIAGDSLDVHVNRVKAAIEGLSPQSITQQLQTDIGGKLTTQVRKGVKFVGVRVWGPQSLRDRTGAISKLLLRAPDGHLVPLSRVATVKIVSGQPELTRYNLKSDVAVTARISGRSLGNTIADIKQVLNKPGLIPKNVYYQLGGTYKTQQKAFRGLIEVFVAAVALVFFLLLFLYERFRIALAILVQPLLAAGAVFIGLWLTGVELNITAMMGMTMVIGIVTEIAIFYFSELRLIDQNMPLAWSLIRAGRNRMRPIVMSALAFMLALLPLALGLGQGSSMQQPLAIAIITGLLVQIPLVLIVMPVLYRLLSGRAERRTAAPANG
ncbi:efflux RND transporter permease subunit [Salinisphaera hydrothermalis]|uniref:Multidrug efflux transporter AcrB (Acriflavin resistance) n=1 Tax=Salinisphaera hydrothermalis (strain C41B8) TaxID=1304275 RepID=A0A084IIF4_SALHC|nr:efflux RND transporter permease subunit [Salinisphaera hydrothermalis]KEZ76488.1 multidrug efflux transporter AcrB (acriflavin resistance) [Salinisphaera hydrothermalis C41B8]